MQRWWDRLPERLEREEKALREAGLQYEIDEAAREAGRLEIMIVAPHPIESGEIELHARFPDSYPYFPPLVFSDDISLNRHQHPTEGLLCLLAENGRDWRPDSDCLASLLQEQLPKLGKSVTAENSGNAVELEARQGEPITAFLDYESRSHVSVPPVVRGQDHDHGKLIIRLESAFPLRGAVLRVLAEDDSVVAEAETGVRQRYTKGQLPEVIGRWYRLPRRPRRCDAETLLAEWKELFPEERHCWQQISARIQDPDGREISKFEVIGFVFEDELAWREHGSNWLILVNRRHAQPLPGGGYLRPALIRAELESSELRRARVPELAPLADKTIAVFGLGSLGSVAVLELARAGVKELALLDSDLVEIGNTVRWATGRRSAGLSKVEALCNMVFDGYPHTRVRGRMYQIGSCVRPAADQDAIAHLDGEILDWMLDNVDLVLDASASIRLNHYLADIAAEREIPYIWMSTTNGGWGGLVGRIVPGKTSGCWMCHLHGLNDGSITGPASKPADQLVQPVGCMDPTFAGASFDIAEVTMMGVRLVTATLSGDYEGAYPDFDWNLAVVDLRDSNGKPIPPQWRTYALDAHAACCGA